MEEDERRGVQITEPRHRRRGDAPEPFVTYQCELCGRRPDQPPREHYGMHQENAAAFLEVAIARGDREGEARARGWIESCRRILIRARRETDPDH